MEKHKKTEIKVESSSNEYEKHVDLTTNMDLIRDIADLQSRIELLKNNPDNEFGNSSDDIVRAANEKDIKSLEDALFSLYDQLKTNIVLSANKERPFSAN